MKIRIASALISILLIALDIKVVAAHFVLLSDGDINPIAVGLALATLIAIGIAAGGVKVKARPTYSVTTNHAEAEKNESSFFHLKVKAKMKDDPSGTANVKTLYDTDTRKDKGIEL